jgi:putative endonuclease
MRNPRFAACSGYEGEVEARRYLVREHGYRVISQNYRCPGGEIDLVAYDRKVLAFVEVKTRNNSAANEAFDALHWKKRQRIRNAAQRFLLEHAECTGKEVRFDVVIVSRTANGWRCELIRDAFRDE